MRHVLLVALVVTSGACGSKDSTKKSPAADKVAQAAKDLPDGLDMRLSNGKAGPPPFDKTKLAPAAKLGDADVKTILSRAADAESLGTL